MEPRYKLKTAPVFDVITVAELRRQLNIEHTEKDTFLAELIGRAVVSSQSNTGRQYARATYTAYLDEYPDDDEIEITLGPVDAIISVKYLAQDASALTTVDTSKYQLDNVELTARLRFLEEFTPDSNKMNVIEIEFTTGWATAGVIPQDLVEAVILRAAESYLHPENQNLNFGMGLRTTAAENKERSYRVPRY